MYTQVELTGSTNRLERKLFFMRLLSRSPDDLSERETQKLIEYFQVCLY